MVHWLVKKVSASKKRSSLDAMLIEANEEIVYALDNDGKLVCLPDSNDTKVQKGYFVCDDGNVVSEERNLTDAYEKLDDLNEEDWEYK